MIQDESLHESAVSDKNSPFAQDPLKDVYKNDKDFNPRFYEWINLPY